MDHRKYRATASIDLSAVILTVKKELKQELRNELKEEIKDELRREMTKEMRQEMTREMREKLKRELLIDLKQDDGKNVKTKNVGDRAVLKEVDIHW